MRTELSYAERKYFVRVLLLGRVRTVLLVETVEDRRVFLGAVEDFEVALGSSGHAHEDHEALGQVQ